METVLRGGAGLLLLAGAVVGCTIELGPGTDRDSSNGPAEPGIPEPGDPPQDAYAVCHQQWIDCLGPSADEYTELGCNDGTEAGPLNICHDCQLGGGWRSCDQECAAWGTCVELQEVNFACDESLDQCYRDSGFEIPRMPSVEPSESLPAEGAGGAIAIAPGPGVAASGTLGPGGDFYKFTPDESWEGCRFVVRLPGYYLDDMQAQAMVEYSALTLFEDGAARTDSLDGGGLVFGQIVLRYWANLEAVYFPEGADFFLRVRHAPETGIPVGLPYDLQLMCTNRETTGPIPEPLPAIPSSS